MAVASSRWRWRCRWRRSRDLQALVLMLLLIGGAVALAERRRAPFTLQCQVQGAETLRLRVQPRLQQVELLDPRSGAVIDTLTTSQPPPELGPGIIDDSTVTISDRQILWERTMYRPQFVRERHRIDRASLAYRSEETMQIAMGPEMAEQIRTGLCHPIEASGTGAALSR